MLLMICSDWVVFAFLSGAQNQPAAASSSSARPAAKAKLQQQGRLTDSMFVQMPELDPGSGLPRV